MSKIVTGMDEALDQFIKPMEFFKEKAIDGELDLVAQLRGLFIKHGASEEDMTTTFDNSHFIQDAANKHASAQQFLLNRYCADEYFKKELENIDTRLQRHVLIYNIRSDDWLKIMDQTVVPTMLEMGLPKQGAE